MPLVIAGEGPERAALERARGAARTVRFAGRVEDARARGAARRRRARARAVAQGRDVRAGGRGGDGRRAAGRCEPRGGAAGAGRSRGCWSRPATRARSPRRSGALRRSRRQARGRASGCARCVRRRWSRAALARGVRRHVSCAKLRVPPARSALITGITGQDGSFLAELLLEKDYTVTGLIRHSEQEPLGCREHLRGRVELVRGDLLEPVSLREAIEQVRPRELYHLAAPSYVPASWQHPAETLTAIAGSCAAILEAVRDLDSDTRVFVAVLRRDVRGSAGEPPARGHPLPADQSLWDQQARRAPARGLDASSTTGCTRVRVSPTTTSQSAGPSSSSRAGSPGRPPRSASAWSRS